MAIKHGVYVAILRQTGLLRLPHTLVMFTSVDARGHSSLPSGGILSPFETPGQLCGLENVATESINFAGSKWVKLDF